MDSVSRILQTLGWYSKGSSFEEKPSLDTDSGYHWASFPKQRTMVLRELTPYNLVFFTDKRSDKCREILEHPSVSVHSYNPKTKTQIQFYGTAHVTTDHPKFQQWRSKGLRRDQDYTTTKQPGAVCADYTSVEYNPALATDNFILLIVEVKEIQLLRLETA